MWNGKCGKSFENGTKKLMELPVDLFCCCVASFRFDSIRFGSVGYKIESSALCFLALIGFRFELLTDVVSTDVLSFIVFVSK